MKLFDLDFPDDLDYLAEHDVWARFDGDGIATCGISAFGIKLAGEIYYCRPKAIGSLVEQGRALAVVELAKAIVAVKSPVGGTIVEINPLLADQPEWLHREPYGRGWIARVQTLADARAGLVRGEALAQALAARPATEESS